MNHCYVRSNLMKNSIFRYSEAWDLCRVIDTKECWLKLATAALTNLNIDKGKLTKFIFYYMIVIEVIYLFICLFAATEVYSHIGDVGMVMSLTSLKYVEDKKLLCGHICKFLKQFDRDQVHETIFLSIIFFLFKFGTFH